MFCGPAFADWKGGEIGHAICSLLIEELAYDPEKWEPVFGKDHTPEKIEQDGASKGDILL
jgi:hypothetical protein